MNESKDIKLTASEKRKLLSEYNVFYENQVINQGVDALNVKLPKSVFSEVHDQIALILKEESREMSSEEGAVKEFLDANPLPTHMKDLLPDDFRAYALLLNSLKQWVAAESLAVDRYLLGGGARKFCKEATDHCMVTKGELGDNPELHHPLRDGRPPVLISKMGHEVIERRNQNGKYSDDEDNELWKQIKKIRKDTNYSWKLLREGCEAIDKGIDCRPNAKSCANRVLRETGSTIHDLICMLDERNL